MAAYVDARAGRCYFLDAVKEFKGDVCALMDNERQRRRLLIQGNMAYLGVLHGGKIIEWWKAVSGTPSHFTPDRLIYSDHVSMTRMFYDHMMGMKKGWKAARGAFPFYFATGSSLNIAHHMKVAQKELYARACADVRGGLNDLMNHMADIGDGK